MRCNRYKTSSPKNDKPSSFDFETKDSTPNFGDKHCVANWKSAQAKPARTRFGGRISSRVSRAAGAVAPRHPRNNAARNAWARTLAFLVKHLA